MTLIKNRVSGLHEDTYGSLTNTTFSPASLNPANPPYCLVVSSINLRGSPAIASAASPEGPGGSPGATGVSRFCTRVAAS